MDGQIDELDILIEAGAGKAVKELNALMRTLKDVRSVLAGATRNKADLGEKDVKKAQGAYNDFLKAIKNVGKITVDSSDIKKVKGTISRLESSLSKLQDKNLKNIALGVDENSKSFKNNIYDIIKTNNLLDAYKSKLAEISVNRPKNYWEVPEKEKMLRETGSTEKPTVNLPSPEEINEMAMSLGDIKRELTGISGNGGFENASKWIDEYVEKTFGAADATKKLGTEAKRTSGSLNEEGRAAGSIQGKFKQFGIAMQAFKKVFNGADRALKNFGSGVKRAFAPVGYAIGDATKRLLGFKKESGKKMSIGRMVGMSVLYSSVFQVISLIKKAIAEGSQNLAQYSAEYNKSISSIMSALMQLKNAFAVAFAPIVNVVAPYLVTFINMVSKALNVVGQFFAALTGKSYSTQAVKVYGDYAAGLDKTGKGAKNANKSMKDLKRTILGFDELNVLNDNSDTKDSGAGAIGGISPSDMFTDVPIAKNISEFAKKLRSAIKKEDWYGLGKIIADGFNKGMQKLYDAINWNKVGPKITYFVNAFTATMNSIVGNVDWDLMGRTVGAGINTIIKTLNLLIDGFNWKQLGAKFANGINGIFTEVDFTGIGNFIGGKFMIIWNILNGFFNGNGDDKGLNYALMGKKFGDGINGIFQKVDFTTIAQTLSGALNGLAQIIQNFVLTVEWDDIAKNLYDGINYFIHNTNWAELGKSLSDLVTSLLGTIRTAVDNTDWHAIGKAIGDFLGSIDWGTIIGDLGDIIWTAFSGMISGLFDSKDGKVILAFGAGLLAIKGLFKAFTLAPEIGMIVQSVGTLASGLVSLLGPVGLAVVGIIAGVALIIANWDKIKDAAGKVYESVSKWWGETQENTSRTWESVKEQVGGAWDDLKENASTKFKGIHDSISGWWSETKENTRTTWDSVSGQVQGVWGDLKTKAGEKFGGIVDTIKSAWDKNNRDSESQWGIFGKILSGNWEDIGKDANDAISGIVKGFKDMPGTIQEKLGGLWDIGRNAIKSFADGFSNFHIPLPHVDFSTSNFSIGGLSIPIPKFKLNWYKNGGMPSGEIWGMNEQNNPEMIGRVGNKTAVANNAIIADAIKSAVVDGMMEVYMSTGESGNSNEPPIIEFTYIVDSETQYKTMLKGKEKYNRRYSAIATN